MANRISKLQDLAQLKLSPPEGHGKSERVKGQESLHTEGDPTGYLCSATVDMKLDNSAYNSCVAPSEMALRLLITFATNSVIG